MLCPLPFLWRHPQHACERVVQRVRNCLRLPRERASRKERAKRGVAATAALTTATMPSAPGRTSWAMNTAVFHGEIGLGFSVAHRLNTSVPLYVSGGYSNGGGQEHIVRAGLGGEF